MRRRFTEAERRRFLAELKRSGDSIWKVAQRLELNPTTAYRWAEARQDDAPTFVRVVRSTPARGGGVAIEVGAARVVVEAEFDPSLLRAVVAALSEMET